MGQIQDSGDALRFKPSLFSFQNAPQHSPVPSACIVTDGHTWMQQVRQEERLIVNKLRAVECISRTKFAVYGFHNSESILSLISHRHHTVGIPHKLHLITIVQRTGKQLASHKAEAGIIAIGTPHKHIPASITRHSRQHIERVITRTASCFPHISTITTNLVEMVEQVEVCVILVRLLFYFSINNCVLF